MTAFELGSVTVRVYIARDKKAVQIGRVRVSSRCHMYITRKQTYHIGIALGIGHCDCDCDSESSWNSVVVGLVRTVTWLVYLVSLQFTSAGAISVIAARGKIGQN